MRIPRKKEIEEIKKKYPVDCRVRLLKMDDVQAPPIGTEGTVKGVDDTGSIMVDWDNGSALNVIYDIDKIEKIKDKGQKNDKRKTR